LDASTLLRSMITDVSTTPRCLRSSSGTRREILVRDSIEVGAEALVVDAWRRPEQRNGYLYRNETMSPQRQFNGGADLTAGHYVLTISDPSFFNNAVAEFDIKE
jgi:hypothetical protein